MEAIGTGGAFPSSGTNLETIVLRPYILNAKSLAEKGIVGSEGPAEELRCGKLLGTQNFVPDGGWPNDAGSAPFEEGKDYWRLGDIPAGTLKSNHTYVLAIVGCAGDATSAQNLGKCGYLDDGGVYQPTGTPGIGSLRALVMEIDAEGSAAADELGAQVIHLSPGYQFVRDFTGGVAVKPFRPFVSNGSDAGDAGGIEGRLFLAPNGGPDAGEVTFPKTATGVPTPTPLVRVKGLATSSAYFAADPASPAIATTIPMVLNNTGGVPSIQLVSTNSITTQQMFINGTTYTFVLVGDPTGSGLRGPHYLGFPNKFTPAKL